MMETVCLHSGVLALRRAFAVDDVDVRVRRAADRPVEDILLWGHVHGAPGLAANVRRCAGRGDVCKSPRNFGEAVRIPLVQIGVAGRSGSPASP